jgi:hypothetical protein
LYDVSLHSFMRRSFRRERFGGVAMPRPDQTAASKRRILNPVAAAEYMDNAVTVGTLAKWRSAGVGPSFIKIGNKVFYEESALDHYIQSCRVQPGSAAA